MLFVASMHFRIVWWSLARSVVTLQSDVIWNDTMRFIILCIKCVCRCACKYCTVDEKRILSISLWKGYHPWKVKAKQGENHNIYSPYYSSSCPGPIRNSEIIQSCNKSKSDPTVQDLGFQENWNWTWERRRAMRMRVGRFYLLLRRFYRVHNKIHVGWYMISHLTWETSLT